MSIYVGDGFENDIKVFFDEEGARDSSCSEIRCAYNNKKNEKFGYCNLKTIPRRRGYNICIIATTIQLEENQQK